MQKNYNTEPYIKINMNFHFFLLTAMNPNEQSNE